MKRTKKLLVALLTTLLALPLFCATALAEDPTYTFVVKNNVAGYEYLLYQMFTGDISNNPSSTSDDDKYILSNIKWGSAVPEATQQAMYDMYELVEPNRNAASVAEKIAEAAETDSNVFHEMMTYMAKLQKTNGESLQNPTTMTYGQYTIDTENGTGYYTSGLKPGYYLVRNTKVPADSNQTNSDYIIKVLGQNVFADTKSSTVNLQKKTQNKNDSYDATVGALRDTADYDIGDSVPFTLTMTLPSNYDKFEEYHLIFEDDMSAGLAWDGNATVTFGNSAQSSSETFTTVANQTKITVDGKEQPLSSKYEGGQLWKLDIPNLKAYATEKNFTINPGDTITVTYNATIKSTAATTVSGNPNRYRVIFSNNPATTTDELASTTYDTNVVFTYKTVFNKVNENNQPLTGADFKLEKFIYNASGTDTIIVNDQTINGTWTDVTTLNGTTHPTKTGTTSDTSFTFSGLDDGHYRLTESTTPTGYNTIAPQEFDIVATHSEGDDPKLLTLTGTGSNDFTMTSDVTNATLSVNIQNKKGTVLPTTGGTGTTALYVVGGLLLGGSVVAFIVKRRMRA